MTDLITSIDYIINKDTKKKRHIRSNEEVIKQRLHQDFKCKLVYEGCPDDNLKEIRSKLKHSDNSTLQIRGNKIYEIRKKITKLETIKYSILETIKILKEKKLVDGETNELYQIVYNSFHNGSEKIKYIIKTN